MISSIIDYEEVNKLSSYKITSNAFNHVIVYKENDIIFGFLDYSVMYERAEINYIFVKEEYRNMKIGSYLLKSMLDKEKVKQITLEVNVNNINAIKLYKKFGFQIVSIRKGYYEGIDGYLMLRSGE